MRFAAGMWWEYRIGRDVYAAYRKSGYSKKFFEEHRAEITIHKAAKDAFNDSGFKKLPSIRKLRQEYAELLTGKSRLTAAIGKRRN